MMAVPNPKDFKKEEADTPEEEKEGPKLPTKKFAEDEEEPLSMGCKLDPKDFKK